MASAGLSFVPDIPGVLIALGSLLSPATLMDDIGPSIVRVLFSLAMCALLGLPLGFWASGSSLPARSISAAISAVRYVPPTAFIGLIIIGLGIGPQAAIALITLGIAPYVALMTADAFRAIPASYLQIARSFGANRLEVFEAVQWPFVLPRFIESIRVNVGAAWTLLVVAELIAGNSGIGFLIARSQRYLDMDRLYALVIMCGILGVGFDWLLQRLVAKASWWQSHA